MTNFIKYKISQYTNFLGGLMHPPSYLQLILSCYTCPLLCSPYLCIAFYFLYSHPWFSAAKLNMIIWDYLVIYWVGRSEGHNPGSGWLHSKTRMLWSGFRHYDMKLNCLREWLHSSEPECVFVYMWRENPLIRVFT